MLFANAKDAIVASINAKNGLFLKTSDIIFGPGQRVSDLVPLPTTTKNSSVLIRVADGKPYSGQARVFYNRLDFATVFAHTPLNTYAKLRVFRPSKIWDLIPALNDYYGLNLTTEDIVDGDLELINGSGTAVITANTRSLGWVGQFTVTIAPGDAKIEQWLTDTDLAGVAYPSGQSDKGQAEVYSYRYDCTTWATALSTAVVGDITQELADLLVEITGDSWTFEAGEYSLQGATVSYCGVNTVDKPSNPLYGNLLEITLGSACTNFAGVLRFHFNLDPDINNVTVVNTVDDPLSSLASYDPRYSSAVDYSTDRINPFLFTAELDYTSQAANLSGIPWQSSWTTMADANATKLATAMAAVDGRPWNTTAGTDYNLRYAYVQYNGPIANVPASYLGGIEPSELFREGFTHVMLLCPTYQQSPNLWYGKAFIYYNA